MRMILSKLGRALKCIGKRVFAFFAALLIMAHAAIISYAGPLIGAVAAGGVAQTALEVVGGAVAAAAFMSASGIYPYQVETGDGVETMDYNSGLEYLMRTYNDSIEDNSFSVKNLRAYLKDNVILFAKDTWNYLSEFTTWIKDEYSLASDSSGALAGTESVATNGLIPVYQNQNSAPINVQIVKDNGLKVTVNSNILYFLVVGNPPSPLYLGLRSSDGLWNIACKSYPISSSSIYFLYNNTLSQLTSFYRLSMYQCYYNPGFSFSGNPSISGAPVYSDLDLFLSAVGGVPYQGAIPELSGSPAITSGLHVDTATISVPSPIPTESDTEFMGLRISGMGYTDKSVPQEIPQTVLQSALDTGLTVPQTSTVNPGAPAVTQNTETGVLEITPGAVIPGYAPQSLSIDDIQSIIMEQGIEDRARPVVTPVEVIIPETTIINPDTGVVESGTVVEKEVVNPDTGETEIVREFQPSITIQESVAETIPALSQLVAPSSVISDFVTAIQTKFPFCVPFDIARLFQAFVFAPQAPVISMTFYEPFTNKDYSVSVDLSPWNDVAAIVRQLQTIILVVGYSLAVSRLLLTRDVLSGDLI